MDSFRPSRFLRSANRVAVFLLQVGVPIGVRRSPMALLTVPGRRSGKPRTAPVALAPRPGGWTLIAAFGPTDWSKNLEAAEEAVVTRKRRSTPVSAHRLRPLEAAPILRDSVLTAPRIVQRMSKRYFKADAGAPISEWETETIRHPVFVLTPFGPGDGTPV